LQRSDDGSLINCIEPFMQKIDWREQLAGSCPSSRSTPWRRFSSSFTSACVALEPLDRRPCYSEGHADAGTARRYTRPTFWRRNRYVRPSRKKKPWSCGRGSLGPNRLVCQLTVRSIRQLYVLNCSRCTILWFYIIGDVPCYISTCSIVYFELFL
jgi:hypothetical protein